MLTFWTIILVLNQGTVVLKDLPAASTGATCLELVDKFLKEKPDYKKEIMLYGCIRKTAGDEL